MEPVRARQWWSWWAAGTFGVLALSGCASIPIDHASPNPAAVAAVTEDDEFSQLIAQLKTDLTRLKSRESDGRLHTSTEIAATHEEVTGLRMPVVGITARQLNDSWGDPRDGGERRHKGIDIFAHRGTQIVAVADGIISYIGDQPKGGHCLWLTTENGASFYYAHLERWAPGIYEGLEVQSGDLLGFVGNTGNAITTPPHLHFGINQNDEMVNPYPVLTRAVPVQQAHVHIELGGGFGTR
jgi:murein DD-endopeptidase MepM/ murein hydrolase activator NlpD